MAVQSGINKPGVPARRAFADLRKRNEYRSRVARMLEAGRKRQTRQFAEVQPRHRTHQAR